MQMCMHGYMYKWEMPEANAGRNTRGNIVVIQVPSTGTTLKGRLCRDDRASAGDTA